MCAYSYWKFQNVSDTWPNSNISRPSLHLCSFSVSMKILKARSRGPKTGRRPNNSYAHTSKCQLFQDGLQLKYLEIKKTLCVLSRTWPIQKHFGPRRHLQGANPSTRAPPPPMPRVLLVTCSTNSVESQWSKIEITNSLDMFRYAEKYI